MAKLTLDSGWDDMAYAYKVILGDNIIGDSNNGEEIEFAVPDGKHKLFLKIHRCRSNKLDLDVSGNSIIFECVVA